MYFNTWSNKDFFYPKKGTSYVLNDQTFRQNNKLHRKVNGIGIVAIIYTYYYYISINIYVCIIIHIYKEFTLCNNV